MHDRASLKHPLHTLQSSFWMIKLLIMTCGYPEKQKQTRGRPQQSLRAGAVTTLSPCHFVLVNYYYYYYNYYFKPALEISALYMTQRAGDFTDCYSS